MATKKLIVDVLKTVTAAFEALDEKEINEATAKEAADVDVEAAKEAETDIMPVVEEAEALAPVLESETAEKPESFETKLANAMKILEEYKNGKQKTK